MRGQSRATLYPCSWERTNAGNFTGRSLLYVDGLGVGASAPIGRAAGCEHSPDYERSCGYEHSGNSINLQDHL